MKKEIIVDSFAGAGGASLGIAWALGRAPDIAINHDEHALRLHARNHPDTHHVREDVWKADLRQLVAGRKVGLLWASPDCFCAGTLILTRNGLKPIEQIRPGEEVLTHENRWKPVLSTLMRKASQTVTVRGHGHYGLVTTPGHQFYSKRITTRYPNARRANGKRVGPQRILVENPYWPPAQSMAGKLWATPQLFPVAAIPQCTGAEFSEDFFYWLGRWLGDGSLNKGDVEICGGRHEYEAMERLAADKPLRRADGIIIKNRIIDRGSTIAFAWGDAPLAQWLAKHFGCSCETKSIPPWCLSMQVSWRRALLHGYMDADGHSCIRQEASSVSKALIIGMRLLATSLGYAVAMYFTPGKPGCIEGREFTGRDSYRIAWREELQRQTVYRDTRHVFSPCREVTESGPQVVYSLEVADDESYVADGIVVHNCRHFSRAKGGTPVSKQIRSLAWIVCRWAAQVQPRVIILENVREFADWGPLVPQHECRACRWKGTEGAAVLARSRRRCPRCDSTQLHENGSQMPDPARKGLTFKRWVGRLRGLGYDVEWRNLDAADYGAPTHRNRLFLIARRDGQPITWPAPTHGKRHPSPWRTAAECIDWDIPCPSIFDRKKPLAEKTMRRIALGIKRYVLENSHPFIVRVQHGRDDFRGQPLNQPLQTITGKNGYAAVAATLAKFYGGVVGSDLGTVTAVDHHGLVVGIAATFLTKYHGLKGGESRGLSLDRPVGTLDTSNRFGLVCAFLVKYFGTAIGAPLDEPMPTATAKARFCLVRVEVTPGQAEPAIAVDVPGMGPHVIADIGLRMLTPRELARAQGFPDTHLLDGPIYRQVRGIGNSVSPCVAKALAAANYQNTQAPLFRTAIS